MYSEPVNRIIRNIAEIQVSALESLSRDSYNTKLLDDLISKDDYESVRDELIDLYKQMVEMPQLIKLLNEYQLGVCVHILYRMEDEWLLENGEGVYGVWHILFELQGKFHPEYKLIIS